MRSRWSCVMAGVVAMLLAGVSLSHAARLPEWAQALASGAPELPSGVASHDFRVLLDERRIVVEPDGKFLIRERLAKQALSSRSEKTGVGETFIGPNTSIVKSRAWHLAPGRRARRGKRRSVMEIADLGSFVSDRKIRTIDVPGLERGSLVFVEFLLEERPYLLSLGHSFYNQGFTDVGRLVVELPPGWGLDWEWVGSSPGASEPRHEGQTYTWELRGLPGRGREPFGPPLAELAPRLALSLTPAPGARTLAPPVPNWISLAEWVGRLIAGRGDVTGEIAARAEKLVGGKTLSFGEKLDRCARYVRDKVRYVSVLIGISGYQPRTAAETDQTLWGDCKDKGNLLSSLLTAEKIESYPVLVNATLRGAVGERVPTLGAFDHYIVAVEVPEGEPVPPRLRPASASIEGIGTVVFVDPTDEFVTPGWLSASLAGKRALLVAGKRSRLVTLPGRRPEDHRVEEELEIALGDRGPVSFLRRIRAYGASARPLRSEYAISAADRKKSVVHALRKRWIDAELTAYEVQPETEEGAYEETLGWRVPALRETAAGQECPLFDFPQRWLPRLALARRELPVLFRYPRNFRVGVTVTGVPPGLVLPEGRRRSGEGWSVETSFSRGDGQRIKASWELILQKTDYSPEEFRSLRRLYAAASSLGGTLLPRRQSKPASGVPEQSSGRGHDGGGSSSAGESRASAGAGFSRRWRALPRSRPTPWRRRGSAPSSDP